MCANNTEVCPEDKARFDPEIDDETNRVFENQFGDSNKEYVFDTAGNMIKDSEGRQFFYDGENKQREVKDAAGNVIGKYFFDGDGKRVKKEVWSGTAAVEVVIFVYDASSKLIAEYSTAPTPQEPKVNYVTSDHLGSPRINTDQDGRVSARHDYMPYGEEIARSSYGTDEVRQKFTSYERDTETDLDFAQARYFGSPHGRFTSPDPYKIVAEVQVEKDEEKARKMLNRYISQPQQWNAYAYAVNNPLKYTDPSGEKIDLTGETAEERAAALQRLRNTLGEERFKLVTVSADGRSVSLSNENVAAFQKIGDDADNKDFSLGFAEILNSNQSVEFRVTEKFTNVNGKVIDLNTILFRGALTVSGEASSTGNIQIFVHPQAGAIATKACEMLGDCKDKVTPNTGNFVATNEMVDAHEFGHARDRLISQGPPSMGARPNTQEWWKSFENAVRSRNPKNSQRRVKH